MLEPLTLGEAEHFIEIPGLHLFCRVLGQGPPVVFLHGFGQDNSMYEEIEQYLSRHFTLLLIDSRGHGTSGKSKQAVTTLLMAEDVVRVLDYFAIPRSYVVGFSDGANTALQLAVSYPARLQGIVAISANARPSGLKKRILAGFKLWQAILTLGSVLGIAKARNQLTLMALLLHQPQITLSQLKSIQTPALLLWAQQDFIMPAHIAEISNSIQGSQKIIVPHSRHLSIIKKWPAYIRSIEQFLHTQQG